MPRIVTPAKLRRVPKGMWPQGDYQRSLSGGGAPDDILRTAIETYIYLYPLVVMEVYRRQAGNLYHAGTAGAAATNAFGHIHTLARTDRSPGAWEDLDLVSSRAWLDAGSEPIVVTVPAIEDRFHVIAVQDMWTDVFAVISTGMPCGSFAVVPPGWTGSLPAHVVRMEAPTPNVLLTERILADDSDDALHAIELQDALELTPLSQWGRRPRPQESPLDPAVDVSASPLAVVASMTAEDCFAYAAELLKRHRPHLSDWSVIAKAVNVGVIPGKSLQLDTRDALVTGLLRRAAAEARRVIEARSTSLGRVLNGWRLGAGASGAHGNSYLERAAACMASLDALPQQAAFEAWLVSDADDRPLQAGQAYSLTLRAADCPPRFTGCTLNAFDDDGVPTGHVMLRRSQATARSDDRFDASIQREPTDVGHWLRIGTRGVRVRLRLYGVDSLATTGWAPPPVQRRRSG